MPLRIGSLAQLLRSLLAIGLGCGAAVEVQAQCFTATGAPEALIPDSPHYAATDEGMTAESPLGFTFPMAGSVQALTHFVVDANGEVYLTDGQGVVNPSNFGTSSLASMRGGAGGSPRVMAVGGDNEGPHPTSQVLVDLSVAGECKVTWVDWSRFGANQEWDCSVTLSATGSIRFDYSQGFGGFNFWDYVGVSVGNDVGSQAVPSSSLLAGGDSGALGLVYQNTWPPFDLEHRSVTFTPNGSGGYGFAVTCFQIPANHLSYGDGCYDIALQCVYAFFATPAAAANNLQGQSLTFMPSGDGYLVANGAASYIAPSAAATNLLLGDEDEANVTPSAPFPHVSGPVATMSVCSNGFVNMGPIGSNAILAHGSVFDLLNSPIASFRSNADFDPSANGDVFAEEVGGTLMVTWQDVYRFGGSSPERLQMQFDLTTGQVAMVWDQLSSSGIGPMVVGYAPGPSLDPGPTTLAAALPVTTAADRLALQLSASPPPVSTPSSAATVTFQIDNIPDANVNSGIFFGVTITSLVPMSPPVDLSVLGMPGCDLHVSALEIVLSFVGTTPSQATQLALPPAVPPGVQLFTQSAALVFPGSLPNGQNAFGAVTSNAVRSLINSF